MASAARPKILHLIDTGGPGGAETVFLRIAAGLAERGWEAMPVVGRDDWLAAQLRRTGIEPTILDAKGSFNLAYLRQLRRLVRAQHIGAVVTHLYGSAIYGALLGLITRTPVIAILHGQSDISAAERFSSVKARIVAAGATRLVAVSTALREDLSAAVPAPAARWSVIPNGIDVESLYPGGSLGLRQRLGLAAETRLVGALGNIRKPKAYDVFLNVAARVTERDPGYHFVIAGQGSDRQMDALLALRKQLGLEDKVTFHGLENDIRGYLGDLDMFMLTSSTEGFSIACVEAMACGLPVVATRSGGPQDIVVDGETGVLVDVGDVAGLATAVSRLGDDARLRERMGQAGRARAAACFSLEAMLDAYEHLVQEALRP